MANFNTHISTSAVLGIGYGAVGHTVYHMPLPASILAAGLCTVAGILPDVDADRGHSLREVMAFLAAVILGGWILFRIFRFRKLWREPAEVEETRETLFTWEKANRDLASLLNGWWAGLMPGAKWKAGSYQEPRDPIMDRRYAKGSRAACTVRDSPTTSGCCRKTPKA